MFDLEFYTEALGFVVFTMLVSFPIILLLYGIVRFLLKKRKAKKKTQIFSVCVAPVFGIGYWNEELTSLESCLIIHNVLILCVKLSWYVYEN